MYFDKIKTLGFVMFFVAIVMGLSTQDFVWWWCSVGGLSVMFIGLICHVLEVGDE